MMNGHGKSDRPIVPEKSPNKAGRPGAEGMEGRGLAKGNLRQRNAPRTPSRNGAPSALERVRQASLLKAWRHYLRQEPDAVIPLVRICAGGRPKGRSLPRLSTIHCS